MLAEQFAEFCDGALLVVAEMVLDVPLEIIAPEIRVKLLARFNDVVERLHAEAFGLLQFAAQHFVLNSAPQRPDRINKRQIRQLRPRQTEVENLVRMR